MPVRFSTAVTGGAEPQYLIPAPFVNINKTFDKQGDGEILGSRYTIQLDGYLVADRGSPKTDGTFITNGVDVIDTNLTVGGGGGKTGWYESLQNKQKALANLISKIESGAFLEVLPLDDAQNGFNAHVRLESVDLPSHDPGDPYKSKYTINLSADVLIGANTSGLMNDEDDWHRQEKWMISAASENYQVEEIERSSIGRATTGGTGTIGEIEKSDRVYRLTRTISATGKNKFKRETSYADGMQTGDGFTTTYEKNGRAWQQARGFVYDIIKYGNEFIFGHDDLEYEYNGGDLPKGKTVPVLGQEDPDDYHLFSLNLPTKTRLGSEEKDQSYKSFNYKRVPNIDVKGGTFSVTETWILAPETTYATETVEISTSQSEGEDEIQVTINGTIEGVLDNADNAGVGNQANEDKSAKRVDPVNENLNFNNKGTDDENKDTNSKYQNALHHWGESVFPHLKKTAEAILRKAAGTRNITISEKEKNRNVTHQPAQGIITYSVSFTASKSKGGNSASPYIPYVTSEDISLNDTYPGQTFAEQVVLGRRLGPVLQDIGTQTHWLRELTISCKVNTGDPHICVNAEDEITSAGTYDECTTGTCTGYDDEGEEGVTAPTTRLDCIEVNGTWTPAAASCSDGESLTQSACEAADETWTEASPEWIANPNYAGIGTSNINRNNTENALHNSISTGNLFTNNMVISKPGYVLQGPFPTAGSVGARTAANLGQNYHSHSDATPVGDDFDFAKTTCTVVEGTNDPDISQTACHWPKYKQFIAIKKLLNSLDPMTYMGSDYSAMSLINGNRHVTKRFMNPPSESWNPKTGDWSYSISWVYELDDPHTTFSSSFFNYAFDDELHNPEFIDNNYELNRTAPGQYF
tara:strand:+ start:7676 stop:10273 length:2598 start_codon:yes stop_codon:yes gene_type:complete